MKKYSGPDAVDRAIGAFRAASLAVQFAQVQKHIRAKRWAFLRHLILRTACVRDGLLCDLPRGFLPGAEVKKVWAEKREVAISSFEKLPEQQKAERIIEAERLGQHGFLRLLIQRTDCVLDGFISRFPKLSWVAKRSVAKRWRQQRVAAVDRFLAATNLERLETLRRMVDLRQWRALADLVEMGGIGRLGWPGEMPDAICAKRGIHQRWLADLREGVADFGNLPRGEKLQRFSESLVFQQICFIREILAASMDGLARLVEGLPCAVLADAELDEKWLGLRLEELNKSPDPYLGALYRMQRLRSEALHPEVARQLGIAADSELFAAWREGWMAFLRNRKSPLTVVPRELAADPAVVLGARREGQGMPSQASVLGVEKDRSRRVPLPGRSDGVLVLEIALRAGAPDGEWREGDAADVLESREAWAWAWRRHLLLKPSGICEPPLQLQNIPQILEAWALSSISSLKADYSLDEHGMPYPSKLNVTLLNGGLLDCWAHAWSQFARRDGRQRVISAVPCELRSHPLLEALCREGFVCLPRDIDQAMAHKDESQRKRGHQSLLAALKKTPIPSALLSEALLSDPEVRSAWVRGWQHFLESRALPSESIPSLMREEASVARAWRRSWQTAIDCEVIPWQCLPEFFKTEPLWRSKVIEKWLSRARAKGWIGPVIPEDLTAREAVFFRWINRWYVLPQRREFLADGFTQAPRLKAPLRLWKHFLSTHAVLSLKEMPEAWQSLEPVLKAWEKGWVHALERNAVQPGKIPNVLSRSEAVREAFRSGWVAKMRFEPLSLWELPESLQEDALLVGALVEGWTKRIESLSEGNILVLPPKAWLSPVSEFSTAEATGQPPEGHLGSVESCRPWGETSLSPLWTDADVQIQKKLGEKCAKIFWRDPEKLKLVLLRHLGRAR